MKNAAIYNLFLAGKYVKAELEYRKSLARNPSDPDVLIMLGTCLFHQEKYEEAIPFLKSGIELSTSDSECACAWFNLGVAYDKLGDYVKSEEACRESLARSPLEPYTYILLEKQDREGEAVGCYQKALNVSTEDEERALAYEGLADIYFDTGEWEKAIENYEAAMCLSNMLKTAENFCNLGFAYEELDDYARAEAAYRESLTLEPSNPDANIRLGTCLLNLAMSSGHKYKYKKAIPFLKSGIKWSTDENKRINAYRSLGTAYFQLKDYGMAEIAFRNCLSLDSSEAYLNVMLGDCLVLQKRYNEAIRYYQNAIDLATNDRERISLYEKLGTAYARFEKYERAEAAFRECLALDPSNVDANINLGVSLECQGKYDEAIPYLVKSIEFDNDNDRNFGA